MTATSAKADVLSLEGITRRFGTVLALDDASLRVRAGTVHAVLGENGAGKTTLMRVAFGMLAPDAGTIRYRGEMRTIASPAAALSLGIGMVHQHFTLVPAMTVAENVALGGRGRFDPTAAAARVRDVAARAGLSLDPDALVGDLPVGAQQRCEIVKALSRDVQLLILDEPTAVLAPTEAAELLRWIRAHADAGHAVVLITHKLRDALAIADDVTVLRRGRTVLTSRTAETNEAGLATAMLGVERAGVEPPTALSASHSGDTAPGATAAASARVHADQHAYQHGDAGTVRPSFADNRPAVFAARDVRVVDARGVEQVRGANLTVRAGEIVGIAAVEGAGHHALLRVLAGRAEPSSGALTRPEVVGFVPEDRHGEALLLEGSLTENVALRGAGARSGRMPWDALRETAKAIVQRYDVRPGVIDAAARTMSGGNQQKFVLGRELESAPSALVVENPSRGLDFLATAAVHAALRGARDGGAAVVLYSSDLDEVLQLCDRVYAMHAGTLVETARDREAVGRAMLGSASS